MSIWILTADKGAGKTSRLQQLLQQAGGKVGGILSPVVAGQRHFYGIRSEKYWPMEAQGEEAVLSVGRFTFSRAAFEEAEVVLRQDAQAMHSLVIDEIGPLELRDEGLADVLRQLLALQSAKPFQLLLVVRSGLVAEVLAHFGIDPQVVQVVDQPRDLGLENDYFYTHN